LLQSKELHALVNVHNKIISNGASDKFFPMLSTSMHVMVDVLEVLATKLHVSEECKELFYLLQKPHVQVLVHYPIPYFLQNKTIIAIEVKRDAITFYATRKRKISITGVMCVA
jgi:hypothetical protein